MLQALNTGHHGSLGTIHANGTGEALARLETLALLAGVGLPAESVRAQIGTSVHAVVHVVRRPDGSRVVTAVDEVCWAPPVLTVRPFRHRRETAVRPDEPERGR